MKYEIRKLGETNEKIIDTENTLFFNKDVNVEWIRVKLNGNVIITTQKRVKISKDRDGDYVIK